MVPFSYNIVSDFSLNYFCAQTPDGFQFMQRSNDTCLAYTLAAICNLLAEIGISITTGILGSSYSPITSIGTSLSVQQQLFVLLKESSRLAESLKLKRLVASNHLAMAKFDLTVMLRIILCNVCLYSLFIFSLWMLQWQFIVMLRSLCAVVVFTVCSFSFFQCFSDSSLPDSAMSIFYGLTFSVHLNLVFLS